MLCQIIANSMRRLGQCIENGARPVCIAISKLGPK